MGGGGFTMEPDNPALDIFVLGLANVDEPRICFLPTASGDPEASVIGFYAAFGDRRCEPTHLSLFRLHGQDISLRDHLLAQDIIYVGGGSMRNMLAIWREHQLDRIMREAWERGIVLCGLSAGSMCWFEAGISKSGGLPGRVDGLGFLPGSQSVHYSAEPDRRDAYFAAVREGMPPGYGVDDGAGLLFRDRELVEIVSSRPEARAYRVELVDGEVQETPLDARFLGDAESPPDGVPPTAIEEMRNVRRLHAERLGRRGLRDL
jgi:dipeptidase E